VDGASPMPLASSLRSLMSRSRLLAAAAAAALLAACGADDSSPSAAAAAVAAPVGAAPAPLDLGVAALAVTGDGAPRLLEAVTAIPAPAGAGAEAAARHHLAQLAPLWLRGPAADLELIAVHPTRGGGSIVRLRQRALGLEIDGGELRVLLRADGSLLAVRGALMAPSATGVDFALAPGAALAAAIGDDTGIVLAGRDVGVRKAGGDYHTLLAPPRSDLAMAAARSKPVLAAQGGHLVPAYVVEYLATTRSERSARRTLVAAGDGAILAVADLIADEPFLYRVWADADGRPLDGPIADWSPHPTAVDDGRVPPYVPSTAIVMDGFNPPRDPWLPAGATATIGNNVEVFTDRNGDDEPTGDDFHGAPSSPGAFDHVYRTDGEPMASPGQTRAAMTHLFYVTNWLHDWWYARGFTEAAGNAQDSNYGRGGRDGDRMIAQAQDGAISYPASDPDGSRARRNNANMFTPADGMSPVMQMYLYTDKVEAIQVTPGGPVPALAYGAGNFDVRGPVVAITDASGNLADGCAPSRRFDGAIALAVSSSWCTDTEATERLLARGARGVVLAWTSDQYVAYPPASRGAALGTTRSGGELLRRATEARLIRDIGVELDSSLDTTIVAHEWGHYLHHRLSDCYSTAQCRALSEGWGDFVALHLQVRAGDDFDGVYALGVYSRGRRGARGAYLGIRRYPYSTDRAKNDLGLRHIANGAALPATVGDPSGDNAESHNAGEVWASMLWEAYRALIARHGFDEARTRMGDYVVAGLLMTPIDGNVTESRDALLTAAGAADAGDRDAMARAFASRGAGTCAVAPPAPSTTFVEVVESTAVSGRLVASVQQLIDDGVSCDRDGHLDPGETGTLSVVVGNAGPVATGPVTVTATPTLAGVTIAPVTVPALAPFTRVTVALRVVAGPTVVPGPLAVSLVVRADGACGPVTGALAVRVGVDEEPAASRRDDVEAVATAWQVTGDPVGSWTRATESAGNRVLHGAAASVVADTQLVSPPLRVAASGALRVTMRHRYWFPEVGYGTDGGVVELSTDDGASWTDVTTLGATLPYDRSALNSWANPLNGRRAFSAKSAGWPAFVPLTIDLSGAGLAGRTVRLRFRVGSGAYVAAIGWEIDDIEIAGIDNTPFPRLTTETGVCSDGVGVDAGAARTVSVGDTVTVTGTVGGLDAPNLRWSQDSGPALTLIGASDLAASFVVPATAAGSDLVLRLTARDGGREVSDTVAIHVNAPPTVDAGADRDVAAGATVTLAAAVSDRDGDPLTLGWTQVAGPAVTLTGAASATPSFVAPVARRDAVIELELVVSDGRTSVADRIAIAVGRTHTVPTVNAGVDRTVDSGAAVVLAGAASDAEGDALTITWSQLEGPAVALSDVHALAPHFTAPVVIADAFIVLRLTVSDGDGTASDDVAVTVRRTRTAPTVDAGPDQTAGHGETVVLAGTASDAEGDPVAVSWTRLSGPAITLTGGTTLAPRFVAPAVTVDSAVVLRLTATDRDGSSADTVTIQIRRTRTAPVVGAGADQTVDSGAVVALAGSASDAESDPVTVTWSQESGPAVTLDDIHALRPRFTAPVVTRDAEVVLRLTGRTVDGEASDTVAITVRRTRRSPVVSAGPDQAMDAGAAVALAGAASDPEDDALSISWTQIEGPTVALSDVHALAPTFQAPVSAREVRLGFRLAVRDTGGADVTDTVVVVVRARPPFVVDAGADQTVPSGGAVALTGTVAGIGSETASVRWSQLAGPTVTLTGAATLQPRFTAPVVTRDAVVTFALTAESAGADPVRDTVAITVQRTQRPPVADAGADRSVASGAEVALEGSGSDPEGDPLVPAWIQTGGPAITLAGAASWAPRFVAPRVIADTAITLQLTVSDGGGSATDTVVVTVRAQRPPVVDAGADQDVGSGAWVALVGSASDAEGDAITASWSQLEGPAVAVVDADALGTGFVAPRVTRDVDVVLRLTIAAGGDVVHDDVVIRVRRTADAPTVDAGGDREVASGGTITLTGTASDPEDDPLTVRWVQASGLPLELDGADRLAVVVTAPRTDAGGEAVLRLVVSDGSAEVSAVVRLTIRGNRRPVVDAGADQEVAAGSRVTLDGVASDDDALTLRWYQSAGQPVVLDRPAQAAPSFVAPAEAATLVFELHADDGLATAADRVTVRVRAPAPTPEPEPTDDGGCQASGGAPAAWLMGLVALLLVRRRRGGA
jgi:hypothetical protein